MLYLFLGKDNFSKQQRLQQLATFHNSALTRVSEINLEQLTEASLFGGSSVFVLDGLINKLDFENDTGRLTASPHVVVLVEESLDKRKKASSQWLKHPQIKVEEFAAPSGAELQQWVSDHSTEIGLKMDKATVNYFIEQLMPPASTNSFVEPLADLWQFDSELRKLAAYSNGEAVTKPMIKELTSKNGEIEAWDITNALAERNSKQAFIAMEAFFANQSADEKAKTIQLNALLADQFRNIVLVQDFLSRRVPDSVILEQTGWKTGRLFIMKKLAGKFKSQQLLSILDKLEHLDIETKSTTLPAQTVLQLILAQLV